MESFQATACENLEKRQSVVTIKLMRPLEAFWVFQMTLSLFLTCTYSCRKSLNICSKANKMIWLLENTQIENTQISRYGNA